MNRFFSKPQFVRHFPSADDTLIRTVGYDDFSTVKPLYAHRVQSFYTWHFVLSGSGVLEIGGKVWRIEQGQMFFIPPGVEMRYYPDENAPWEYVWFSLIGDAANKYGKQLGFSVEEPARHYGSYPGVVHRLKQMFLSLTEENGSVFSALSAFYAILEICTADAAPTGAYAVKKYLDDSFTLPGFNGCSMIQYVVTKWIALACDLLTTTKLSVKSVAYSCGFSDEHHFMKTFKQKKGISALQYRKNREARG